MSDAASANGLLHGARRLHRDVASRDLCDFYHVIDLPDGTTIAGQWDLRGTADQYLGGIELADKRVIEIGPASGFLSFHMEQSGARVATIEPPMDTFWDIVPQAGIDPAEIRASFGAHIERIRNSFWYLHGVCRSTVEAYEADAYRLPPQPAKFDVGVLGSVLLHVSSPVRMLASVAAAVSGSIVIAERYFPDLAGAPLCRLLPSAPNRILETWWEFSPDFFAQYLGVLGFPRIEVTRHRQRYAIRDEDCEMFTLVASR